MASVTSNVGASPLVSNALSGAFYRSDACRNLRTFRYVTTGQALPEALELREAMGDWDSEWSLCHMLRVLRRAILNATIDPNSADQAKLTEIVKTLKNWANLAA